MPPQQAPASPPPSMQVGEIRTMPDKFMTGGMPAFSASTPSGKPTSGRKLVLVVAIVAVVLGAITAGAYFFINSGFDIGSLFGGVSPATNQNQVVPPNTNELPGTTTPTTTPPQITEQIIARDQQRLNDLETIAKALEEYFKQFGSYPQFLSVIPKTLLSEVPLDPLTRAPYTYTAKDNRQSYGIVIDIEGETRFNDQTLVRGTWEFTREDFTQTGTDILPDETATSTVPLLNIDSDGDGLTLAEERLMTTSPDVVDTDGDGYRDNAEISNFYSPVQTGNVRLDEAGLVTKYTSVSYNYSFYYPSSWLVSTVPGNPAQTLVAFGDGGDISVTVSENANKQTSWDWYVANVSSDYNKNNVNFIKVGGYEAVRSLDGLKVYVAAGSQVLSIIYEVGEGRTINYPNIFQLFLDRLQFGS